MDEPPAAISMTRRIVTSAVVIVAALALAAVGFQRLSAMRTSSARSKPEAPPPLVRAQRARRVDYTETLRGYGRARALRRAVVAAEVAGVVAEVDPSLEAGRAVERPAAANGEAGADAPAPLPVLVRIDARDLDDMLERARAEHAAAEAEVARLASMKRSLREQLAVAASELETSERELSRVRGLVPKTLSQSDLDRQKMEVALRERQQLVLDSQVKQNVEAAKAALARRDALARSVRLAERQWERADIRPPFPGRIEARHVSVGERVRVGDPLFTIVDLSKTQIPLALPAGRYDDVAPNAPVRARLPDAKTWLFEGRLERVAPTINAEERTFFVYAVVPGTPSSNPAPPGAHVVAEVEGRTHANVVAVPRRALLGERLFVARPRSGDAAAGTYEVEERTPVISRFLHGVALIEDGIEDGELYLVTNLEAVAGGSIVRLAPEVDASADGDR